MGKREEAVSAFQEHLSRYPDSELAPDVHFWLSEYYGRRMNEEKSADHLEILVETFPSSPLADEALFRWASLLAEKGKVEAARDRFDHLLDRYPDSSLRAQAVLEKADLLIKAGKQEEGRLALEEALQEFSQTEVGRIAAQRLAGLLKEQGQYEVAVDYFKKAKTGDEYEPNAQIQYEIGTCYESMGNFEQALSEYLRVTSSYPKSTYWVVRADLRSAQIFEKLGRWSEAVLAYEKLASWGRLDEAGFARDRLRWIRQQGMAH
jgi:TolA-binding protein